MGKLKTLEVIFRGDLIEQNILLKLGDALKKTKLKADFSASIIIPPFMKSTGRRYPSICVLHVTVDIEDKFHFEKMLKEFMTEEECTIISSYEF